MKNKKSKYNKKNNKKKEESEEEENNNSSNEKSEEEEEIENEEININLIKGNYYIFAKTNKKKSITVPKSSKEKGIQLEIDNFTKGNSRQFEIEQIENGMFRIKSVISGLYLKIKEGFKNDEVVQDELDEDNNEFNWIFEKKDDDKKCIYIKSAVGGFDSEDFYMIIDGYVPKSHAKIIIGNFEPTQKFILIRKV